MAGPSISQTTATATDQRIAATDQARVMRGTGNLSTESGGVTVSGKNTVQGAGAIAVNAKGGKGSTVVIGDTTGAGAQAVGSALNASEVTSADLLKNIAAQNADVLGRLSDTQAQTTQNVVSAISGQASQTAKSISDLAQSSQATLAELKAGEDTGGISYLNKTFLWVALAGLAVVAIIFWRRK